MSVEKGSGIRVKRLFAEGVMVVVSILIAFALDAWWEERQLQQEILEDLTIVEAELAENIRLTDVTIDMMQKVVVNAEALVDAMYEDVDSNVIDIPADSVFWAVFFKSFCT